MKKTILLIFSIFNIFSNEVPTYQIIKDTSSLKILNPAMKDRGILKLRLDNGLRVLIISDKKADLSSAALAVQTGYLEDPEKYPGTAHFLEHMLFKGSKKYPDEAGYFRYIFDNGGSPNAYTTSDKTVYMFSINSDAFEGALDRLSHFFIDPTFDPSHVKRELFAIDQEDSKNIEHDGRRKWMVTKVIGNPNHPNVKFPTGNSKTLGDMPISELVKWYNEHYSSNLMTLVIYSPLDLDVLKEMAVSKFSPIENKGKDPLTINENYFSNDNLSKIVYIKPISNMNIISLEWEVKLTQSEIDNKTLEILAYTLKRGQKNSILQSLKNDYLAENLDIGMERISDNSYLFAIEISLTESGIKNRDEVIKRVHSAINNLIISGIPKYIYEEMENMKNLNYEYQSHEDAFEYAANEAANLIHEDLSSYPRNLIFAKEYIAEDIIKTLKNFSYKSCQYFLMTDQKNVAAIADKKEKWTDAEYTILDMDAKLKTELSKDSIDTNIKLPPPNPFIPTDLKILNDNSVQKEPIKIVNNEFASIYFKKDIDFKMPQVSIILSIKDPILNNDKKNQVLKDLYIKALNEKLLSTITAANEAGLFPEIKNDMYSIIIKINGYSQKASILLEEILKEINNFKISKENFDIIYQSLEYNFLNEKKVLPIFQAKNYLFSVLISNSLTSDEKTEILKNIKFEDFINFKNSLFQNIYIEGFINGNLSLKQSESLYFDIKDIIGKQAFPIKDQYKTEIFEMNNSSGPYYNLQKTDLLGNGVVLVLDQGNFTYDKRSAQTILSQALKESFFTELRSKQKTAYMAYAQDFAVKKRLFQMFAVQSNSHLVFDLITRFEIFIEEYLQDLEKNISKDRFENIKNNLITTISLPDKNLIDQTEKLNFLAFEEKDFSHIEKRVESLKNLSYEDFLKNSKDFLSKENRKRIAVLFEGKISNPFEYRKVIDFNKIGSYSLNKNGE
ncbi:MAG: hypothetical protein A3F40_01080 [Chlamydiae bacterium RIFCSPHIGHO2_12_FULL_27_8]|nr:MAG: hypothetical protein A3F40_01080 [Chlamydiae bacterium RIFCSPHIGHO2_12_FULL_27_8]